VLIPDPVAARIALDALAAGIQRKRVNWVLDADTRGFFDNLSHQWMKKCLQIQELALDLLQRLCQLECGDSWFNS
jgi:hypothetical protein